jgi:hypothetical protein
MNITVFKDECCFYIFHNYKVSASPATREGGITPNCMVFLLWKTQILPVCNQDMCSITDPLSIRTFLFSKDHRQVGQTDTQEHLSRFGYAIHDSPAVGFKIEMDPGDGAGNQTNNIYNQGEQLNLVLQ